MTEAASMAAARWVGRGDKNGADGAAVNAMRMLINSVSMHGVVVIGEGEKDHAPMLFNGEEVGDGTGPACDVAVDPIDGTRLCANGMPNAISVLAVADRGSMYDPSAVFYMSKLVTGPEAAGMVDIDAPPAANIPAVAKAKGCSPQDVTVVILDRPRHAELISEVRATGARIHLITDGDVAGAIMAARDGTGIDLMLGIGGTPEGIIAACALKCLGGVILGKLAPRDDAERRRALDAGHDLDRVLTTDDLVTSDDVFFAATGITDGELVDGVRYLPRPRDHSLAGHALPLGAPSAASRASTSCGSSAPTRRSTSTDRANAAGRSKRRLLGGVRTMISPPRTAPLTSMTGVSGLAGGGVPPRTRPRARCAVTATDTPSGTTSRSRPPITVAYSCTWRACRIAWVKSTSTSPNAAVTLRVSGTTQRPSRRAGPKIPADHPAAVQTYRLRGRHGQVAGQLGQLAERPRGEGPLDPFGVLRWSAGRRSPPRRARRAPVPGQHRTPASHAVPAVGS